MILYFHNKLTRDPKLVIAQNRRKIVMTGQPTPPNVTPPQKQRFTKALRETNGFHMPKIYPNLPNKKTLGVYQAKTWNVTTPFVRSTPHPGARMQVTNKGLAWDSES